MAAPPKVERDFQARSNTSPHDFRFLLPRPTDAATANLYHCGCLSRRSVQREGGRTACPEPACSELVESAEGWPRLLRWNAISKRVLSVRASPGASGPGYRRLVFFITVGAGGLP